MSPYRRYDLLFFTATILEWKPLLTHDAYKDIIINSLKFVVEDNRVYLCAFVIMNNHIHIIWHIIHPHTEEAVQRDFLRFTAQMMIKEMRNNNSILLEQFRVDAKDRKYQVWERNALSIPLRNEAVVLQKLNYIHDNPIRKNYCTAPADYKYSSALYYAEGIDNWGFITNVRD